jgi:hypothetical protein
MSRAAIMQKQFAKCNDGKTETINEDMKSILQTIQSNEELRLF